MNPLTHRARKILSAVVSEYLTTGEAVGSRTVTRRGIDLSAATVRNVMADLEEAGLLMQPHTSAGRVPTDLGLRFFVDSLLKVRTLSPKERDELRAHYNFSTDDEVENVLRDAGKVLSDLSHHAAVLVTPRVSNEVLEHLEFVRLANGGLLAVLVTRSGQVQNRLLHLDRPISNEELERVHNYLAERLAGLSLAEVRSRIAVELASERNAYDQLAQRALVLGQQALPREEGAHVIVAGQAHLIEQALEQGPDAGRLKLLLRALDEKQVLAGLLEKTELAQGIQVFIGAEAQLGDFTDLSVVAASYGPGERPLGTLGIIGPTRMNYSRMIALVDFTAQLISNLIRGQ
jgi:heat-inducible transcriptional repressor